MRLLFLSMLLYVSTVSHLAAESGVLDINWSEIDNSSGQFAARRSPFPRVLTQGVSSVTLPVYLPSSQTYNETMIVVADKHFYSITLPLKGASFVVTGDRTFQQTIKDNSLLTEAQLSNQEIVYSRSEGMMSTDFNRHGANYSMVLECDKPDSDSRCLQKGFLEKLYKELIIVGGRS